MMADERLAGRIWGRSGPPLMVLHGGPAAAGSARDLARGLADRFVVQELFQRRSGSEPLTVARHVADLHALAGQLRPPPIILGHSWGAMLALAYAAEHPKQQNPLVLVGCGTFDEQARQRMCEIRDARTTPEMAQRQAELQARLAEDPAAAVELGQWWDAIYQVDLLPSEPDPGAPPFDPVAHQQTWDDELRLQRCGVHPQSFAAITAPVLLIQGTYDPHPGALIRDGLRQFIPHLEYAELPDCGHDPWRERLAREPFFAVLVEWLDEHGSRARP